MLTASIGIATGFPDSAEQLLQDADLALYKAKALGKNGYAVFESAMQTAAQDRMQLEADLAGALADEQFSLVYQPMLDLESERIVGVEALLRWNHPTAGVVQPGRVHPDRRGERPDRPDSGAGCSSGPARRARLGARGATR